MAELIGTITPRAPIGGGISARGALAGTIAISQGVRYPEYDGPTSFAPTGEAQTVRTSGYVMTSDLTIGPIPSNYGLITWNGAVLTVS